MTNLDNITTVAFDADDTLWENETIFRNTESACKEFFRPWVTPDKLEKKLYETEIKNLELFGYGIKGFMLSMIETAIEMTEGRVTGQEVQRIIDLGRQMLTHPVHLFDRVIETVEKVKSRYQIMIITKGDLFDQELKIARSGIADMFEHIEIVSEKREPTYEKIMSKYDIDPDEFLMVGNSVKSDILPVVSLGGHAVHIPFHTTWVHEEIHPEENEGGYHELNDIAELTELLPKLRQS